MYFWLPIIALLDYHKHSNNKYLIITEVVSQRHIKYKAIMRNLNYNVKFVLDGELYEFESILDTKTLDVHNGQIISLPTGKLIATLQANEHSNNISIDDRFIKMGSAWKVTGIDKSTVGIIKLFCDIDQISTYDDLDNEIADANKLVTYTIDILNNDTSVNVEDTLQIAVNVYANNQLVQDEEVLFISSNNDIATVDSNGLLTAISEGWLIPDLPDTQ